ncbi:MAG: acyltransferase [Novosphingobium lindaniclasticum]|jgi:peptidoglycan/LPS O-acetylase OafA/YrhL|uniref:acyltransferase family protein n=1 Tax=Novosphingobium lindaniclasticum TaxID=1329895 RepID=UPI00240A2EA4|nr:acyltransferase [Novosphingobium lindaniclasticum]MDF2638280.1 acyltransferase [Novosphingobium lindaniclasticum]
MFTKTAHPPWHGRYVTLDGMRGIAAMAVALFHFNISQAPHGYVAVDFFFALSGFVLCTSYLPRWQAGMRAGDFMTKRLVRLYPLFLVGIALTTTVGLVRHYTGSDASLKLSTIAVSTVFNALMLPSPLTGTLFPLNVPAWSLFYELIANLVMIAALFRLPRLALVAVCIASAWWFAPAVVDNGSGNIGAIWSEWSLALARTLYSFCAGMLIAKMRQPAHRPATLGGLICLAAIAAMLLADPQWIGVPYYDLACTLVLSPLLVWFGSRVEPSRKLAPAAWFVGEVSFALYAVHWALIEPMRYFKDDLQYDEVLMAFVFLGACLATAWFCVRWIDVPARTLMSDMLRRRKEARLFAGTDRSTDG